MNKLICFDLDNTLVDSDKAHILAYNEALEKLGFKKKNKNFLKKLFGMPHHKIARMTLPIYNEEISKKYLIEHDKILFDKTSKFVKPFPGIINTLKELKKNYDLAVLSNCNHKIILVSLKHAKIDKKLFKIIIGNDDVKHGKPYPDEVLKAEKLEHHEADFMVGDSIYDVLAGKRAKVKTISVLTGNYSKNLLKKYHPDYILKSVNEIPKILKRINGN